MKGTLNCVLVMLALALIIGAGVSCAPTASPTAVATEPTTAPAAAPTSAPTQTAVTTATAAPPVASGGEAATGANVARISLEELKALIDAKAFVAIIDVRPRESYNLGHIKGAISFPWKPTLTEADLEMLPPGDPIIAYCDCGPGERDSADVAQQLIALGVDRDVEVLADPSIVGWTDAGYPTE